MKVSTLIDTYFELDYEDDDGREVCQMFHRKNDDHLLVMYNRYDIPVILTNAEIRASGEKGIKFLIFEADSERDSVVDTSDSNFDVEVEIYKTVVVTENHEEGL